MGTPPVVTQGLSPTEQNSYSPRPAGWEGAKRLTARRKSVFSFDGSTAVFFLGRQKENGDGIPTGDAPAKAPGLLDKWGKRR